MSATLAANQGVVPNILRLVDLPNRKWHPRAGSLCIRVNGVLEEVGVQALRDTLLEQLGSLGPGGAQQAQRQYPRPPRSDWNAVDPARRVQTAAWISGPFYGGYPVYG